MQLTTGCVRDPSSLQQGLPRPGASTAARQHLQGGCYQPVGRLAGLHRELPLPASVSQVMSTWARSLQLAQLEPEAGQGPSLLGQRVRQTVSATPLILHASAALSF